VSRICFVTCRAWPAISESDALVAGALETRGVSVTPQPWNLPDSDFRGFDAVVLRSNWDYHLDPDGFRAWLARVERDGARVFNPPDLVRWNVSKRYLQALGSAGVPTVPTVPLEADAPDALGQIMATRGWPVVVIKPEIGASAHGTRLVTRATLGEAVAALRSGGLRSPVIVQPFVEEIRTRGEWSLVFIAGAFTHAVLKRPGAGEFRVQAQHGGFAQAAAPPDAVLATGRAALAALPRAPLYARIDGVETRDGLLIMEVEVNEPSLFFTYSLPAAERFAQAILQAI
jgi:glutathione synthase/RimK-type ligase-like ATP-grasp enzyme